jgi:hypothetical protein
MNDPTAVQLGIRRSAEMAAVFMIGDGLLGLLQPKRHVGLWRSDIGAVDVLVRPFDAHPARRRAYGLLQIGAGLILAATLKVPGGNRGAPDPQHAKQTT